MAITRPSKEEKKAIQSKSINTRIIQEQLEQKLQPKTEVLLQKQKQIEIPIYKKEQSIDAWVEFIKSRHADVKQIEEDTLELHQMFKDLAEIIDAQQPSVEIIGKKIESAGKNAEQGHKNLVKK